MSTDNSDANDQIRFIDYSYINFVHPTISTDPGGNVVPVDLKYTQAADTKSLESFQADQTYNNVACGRLLETPNAIKLPQAVQHVDTASLYSQTMHPISSAIYDVGMLMLPNTAPLQTPSSYGLEYPTNCYQEEEALRPEARPRHHLGDDAQKAKCCYAMLVDSSDEKLHHTHRKICLHPDGSTKIVRHNTAEAQGGCAVCGTTFASLWRKLDRKCYCNSCAIRFGIGHNKRMSLPHIWSDAVSSQRVIDYPSYQSTGGLLFSSLSPSPSPSDASYQL
ncbi:hypothetical protein VKS41_007741 [Umbelopsis sp. WA50703]